MATSMINKEIAFNTGLYVISPGTHQDTLSNPCVVCITFSNVLWSLLGLAGNSVNVLGGSNPSSASISFNDGVLTLTNPNTWNARMFAMYPY